MTMFTLVVNLFDLLVALVLLGVILFVAMFIILNVRNFVVTLRAGKAPANGNNTKNAA